MFIVAIGIPMLIHLVQYVIGWGEGVVHDWKLVTKTSRSTPALCTANIASFNKL